MGSRKTTILDSFRSEYDIGKMFGKVFSCLFLMVRSICCFLLGSKRP